MSLSFGLSDAEIDEISSLCHWQFDDERRKVLRAHESCDVRACAGSGKTTLLVAKLIGLTSRWPLQHRGICVLSHTNVGTQRDRAAVSSLVQASLTKSLSTFRWNDSIVHQRLPSDQFRHRPDRQATDVS